MNKLSPSLSFTILCGASVVLWFRPLLDTFTLAGSDSAYTHILIILPAAAALIYQRWKDCDLRPQPWLAALALLLISLLIALAARWLASTDLRLAIQMTALVAWWICSFALCFGTPAWRTFSYPLFFLFWMVPLPSIVLDPLVSALQRGSAVSAQLLFALCRVAVTRNGILLFIPGLDIDVTAECSSIRSSLFLIVTTVVVAYVLLKTPWRRALLIALAVPLSVAKNGLRIFTIAMLSTRVDPGFLTGRLHRQGGVVFLLIALVVVFLLLWALRRGETSEIAIPQLSPAGN